MDLPYSPTTSSDREGTGPEGVVSCARSLRRPWGKRNSPLDFRFPRPCPLIWFTRGREREEEPNATNNERATCKQETEAFSPGSAEDSEHQSRKSFVTKRGTETRSHRKRRSGARPSPDFSTDRQSASPSLRFLRRETRGTAVTHRFCADQKGRLHGKELCQQSAWSSCAS